MNPRRPAVLLSALLLVGGSIAACSPGEHRTPDAAAAGGTADTGMGGMHDMAGMKPDTIAATVAADLTRLDAATADSVKALLSRHREVVDALIADCEEMMRMEKMSPPRKWESAVADVRQDLARMASMPAAEVKQAWPRHRQRIDDMLNMRRDMMSHMKM